jgi:adenine-specific DNA methylase
MTTPTSYFHKALPAYLGGKRRLLPWITKHLDAICPTSHWPNLTFIDLFLGGASVSLWAKLNGFQHVISNDISRRSTLLGEAFLQNQHTRLTREDVLFCTQPHPAPPGWIEAELAHSVFSTRHARALDQGFYWADQHPDPTKRALLKVLLWHLAHHFVAFATSLGTSNRPFAEALDGIRTWELINPKRFTDGSLKRLCEPTWKHLEKLRRLVNSGVTGGSPVTLYQEDVISLLPKVNGDVLYLDPPYPSTTSYEKANHILDQLLCVPSQTETVIRGTSPSIFSNSHQALETLLRQADHIPIWVISYGNKTLCLEELITLVKHVAGHRIVTGVAKHYTHLPHVSQNANNQELLVLAYPNKNT